jgi:two-component system, cell cycle response regulator
METERSLTNIEIEALLAEMKLDKESDQSKTVLLIDDDMWIHRVVNNYLKTWGFTPISALDAAEGVSIAIRERPRLVLLDLSLPDVNGEVVLKMLKKVEMTSNIPVLIVSGNLNVENIGSTYKSGAAGFVSKPVKEIILLRKIRDILLPQVLFSY